MKNVVVTDLSNLNVKPNADLLRLADSMEDLVSGIGYEIAERNSIEIVGVPGKLTAFTYAGDIEDTYDMKAHRSDENDLEEFNEILDGARRDMFALAYSKICGSEVSYDSGTVLGSCVKDSGGEEFLVLNAHLTPNKDYDTGIHATAVNPGDGEDMEITSLQIERMRKALLPFCDVSS